MFFNNDKLKEINKMAIPLMINSITALMIGLIDQAMVGRISVFAFSAVGLISTTLYSITGIFGMLAIAFNILGAKNKGEGDEEEFANKFKITLTVCIAIGILFFIITFIFKVPLLKLMFGLSGELLNEAIRFIDIYSITIGLNLIIFVFSAYFKIINKTKWILYGSLTASIGTVILDYILIYGKLDFPKLGVMGAAISSVLGLLFNLLVYLWVIRQDNILKVKIRDFYKNVKEMFVLTMPLMGQEFLEGTLFIIGINMIISRIGVIEVSVFTLIFSIINIILMPMYSYSSTSLTLVSQKVNNVEEINSIPKLCLKISLSIYFILSIIFILLKNQIPRLITEDTNVILLASSYIPIALIS